MKWIIYLGAWAGEHEGKTWKNPHAWCPYLEFATTVRLDDAIKVAQALLDIMPEHRWAISVKDKDGWAWRDDGREPEFTEDGSF